MEDWELDFEEWLVLEMSETRLIYYDVTANKVDFS